jgi:predicted transcriptional regulator
MSELRIRLSDETASRLAARAQAWRVSVEEAVAAMLAAELDRSGGEDAYLPTPAERAAIEAVEAELQAGGGISHREVMAQIRAAAGPTQFPRHLPPAQSGQWPLLPQERMA